MIVSLYSQIENGSRSPIENIGSSTVMSSSGGGTEPRMREMRSSWKTSTADFSEPKPRIGSEKSSQASVTSQVVTVPEAATSGSPTGENQARFGYMVPATTPLPRIV